MFKTVCAGALLSLVLVSSTPVPTTQPPRSDPLTKAAERYQADVRRVLEPIRRRHRTRLEALKKEFTKKGDLDSALRAKTMLAQLSLEPSQPEERRMMGTWLINYTTGAESCGIG